MTRMRDQWVYAQGAYDQHTVKRHRRVAEEHIQRMINEWMRGKQPGWIGRQCTGEDGQRLSARCIRQHMQRLEDQGIIPMGTGARPAEPETAGEAQLSPRLSAGGMDIYIAQRADCGLRRDRPVGRPTREQDPARAPAPQTGLSAMEQRRRRLEREAAENRKALAGIEPDAAQLAPRQPVSLDEPETAPLMRTPASDSTTGDHEERIRPHGAEAIDPDRDRLLRLTGLEREQRRDDDHDQEEGNDHGDEHRTPPRDTPPREGPAAQDPRADQRKQGSQRKRRAPKAQDHGSTQEGERGPRAPQSRDA